MSCIVYISIYNYVFVYIYVHIYIHIYYIILYYMAVLKRLDIFWLKTRCGKRWKLLVYDAVITNKILIEPTHAAATLLNTRQLKGLRKIYGYIPHTFKVSIQTPTYTKGPMKS